MFIGLNRLQYVCLFRQLIVNLCRSNRVGCLQIASLIRLSVNQRGKLDLLFGKEQFRLRHTIDSDDSIHGRWYSPSTCFGPLQPLWPPAIYFSSMAIMYDSLITIRALCVQVISRFFPREICHTYRPSRSYPRLRLLETDCAINGHKIGPTTTTFRNL